MIETVYFSLFAAICALCAIGVLVVRHPIHGVINLIGVMLGLAGIYALLHAPFLAVVQVLVYAGAIMMLLVFVIMVLNQAKDDRVPRTDAVGIATTVVPAVLLLVVGRVITATESLRLDPTPKPARGELANVAQQMFAMAPESGGWYLLFEAGGVLLLAAVVGAVVLAKRRLDSPEPAAEPAGEHH